MSLIQNSDVLRRDTAAVDAAAGDTAAVKGERELPATLSTVASPTAASPPAASPPAASPPAASPTAASPTAAVSTAASPTARQGPRDDQGDVVGPTACERVLQQILTSLAGGFHGA